ncbi:MULTISPECIES: molecular chaperone DnaJ [unclassified Prochlorococcus]|uniref:molecular chaperone DnaJ n=1 Tax=unclassified Prochlorococcus TaxID=2627481 RepID=UPI000533951F|nr:MULTISPECIES: molecular chaperone DnaJ [unclassified Prochlorococcus]KGG24721.1 putative DnaJ domain [Prochlorococcus sp. MIT 0701]KGG25872.1 putative DnaJ domain [Prochlorococcus sp. MIT 0702]KGG30954.1 putative DnaJ domain [Prochlorococcus sp. MIT 0703]
MKASEENSRRRITVELPNHLIARLDELKREWGLRARGDLLARLLEELFTPEDNGEDDQQGDGIFQINDSHPLDNDQSGSLSRNLTPEYNETKALVLIGRGSNDRGEPGLKTEENKVKNSDEVKTSNSVGIDLPGFVRKRTDNLRESLGNNKPGHSSRDMPLVTTVAETDVIESLNAANRHWISLYGNPPGETVVEAAMIWLARDIWLHVDGTEDRPFTWSAANRLMTELCSSWKVKPATFELVMVVAGILEDPFACKSLSERMPTLIRRFVNRFKRSRQVTSFQTLESTMTLHGALKLLKLPSHAGAPMTLSTIRDAYKIQAITIHPDAGGSTEGMRRLNEAYQLLKELYREKTS